jgi:SAM-dependent methyltransferase
MCAVARQLARRHGVSIETHVSAAEDLGLGDRQFDVIYIGNTLHHVDLEATLDRVLRHLKPGGTYASWDPVAYNPLINLYRRLATRVRTPDEHPLRLRDVRAIRSRFATVEVRWFWLSTLLIFVWMAAVQRRSPNRERYWKTVIDEADRWKNVYRPLEQLDGFLLRWLPFLRPLCWNVVIVGRGPQVMNSRAVAPTAPPRHGEPVAAGANRA